MKKRLKKLTRDHIVPQSRDGSNHADNIRAREEVKHRALHILFDNKLPHEQILQVIQETKTALNPIFVEQLLEIIQIWGVEEIYKRKCYKKKIK